MSKGINYITFENHVLSQIERTQKKGSVKSLRATFREFRKELKLPNRKIMGEEFYGKGFDESLKKYIGSLSGLSRSTVNSKVSRVRFWQKEYLKIENEFHDRTSKKIKKSFSEEVRSLLKEKGLSQRKVALDLGTTPAVFNRWCKDVYVPDRSSAEKIKKLERIFGIPENYLIDILWPDKKLKKEIKIDPYSERIKKLINKPYKLNEHRWPEQLKKEFDEYAEYKMDVFLPIGVKRRIKHQWTINEFGECPSRGIVAQTFATFYGWLVNIKGYSKDTLSLLDMLNVDLMTEFQTIFMYERLGEKVTRTSLRVLGRVISMLKQNDYYGQYPDKLKGIDGRGTYDRYVALYERLRVRLEVRTKDPEFKINELVEKKLPLEGIYKMIFKLRDLRDLAPRKEEENRLSRQLVIIHILLQRPIRRESLRLLKVRDFIKLENGRYRIIIQHLKNKAKHGEKEVSFVTDDDLAKDIDKYLQNHRTRSPYAESEYFFIPMRRVAKYDGFGPMDASNIYNLVYKTVEKYLEINTKFGPHAFRHLVATHLLGLYPEKAPVVAELLNDTVETIQKNYAHKIAEKAQNDYLEHLETMKKGFTQC